MIAQRETPIVGLAHELKDRGRPGWELAHNLRGEVLVRLGADFGKHVVIERRPVVIRKDKIRLKVPDLQSARSDDAQTNSQRKVGWQTYILYQVQRVQASIRHQGTRRPASTGQPSHVGDSVEPSTDTSLPAFL
jgi:hypothetical protein